MGFPRYSSSPRSRCGPWPMHHVGAGVDAGAGKRRDEVGRQPAFGALLVRVDADQRQVRHLLRGPDGLRVGGQIAVVRLRADAELLAHDERAIGEDELPLALLRVLKPHPDAALPLAFDARPLGDALHRVHVRLIDDVQGVEALRIEPGTAGRVGTLRAAALSRRERRGARDQSDPPARRLEERGQPRLGQGAAGAGADESHRRERVQRPRCILPRRS